MPDVDAVVGVSDHGGWAVLVTVAGDGTLLDRRRVELVGDDLPALPHHHEGQLLPPDEGVALVERVRASAEKHSALALNALSSSIHGIRGVALRACPPLPSTIAERITDYRSRNVADWVMYRQVLAAAAANRGWTVHWYEAKALDVDDSAFDLRKRLGPPWSKDHKLAMAAARDAIGS